MGSVDVSILIDSGADADFIDKEYVGSTNFLLIEMDVPQPIKAINGTPLETVIHQMVSLALNISGN